MSNMESQPNQRRRSHNLVQGQPAKGQAATKGQVATGDPDQVENHANDLLYHLTPVTDVGRGNPTRHRPARLWTVKGPITLEPPYNFSELYQSGIVLAE